MVGGGTSVLDNIEILESNERLKLPYAYDGLLEFLGITWKCDDLYESVNVVHGIEFMVVIANRASFMLEQLRLLIWFSFFLLCELINDDEILFVYRVSAYLPFLTIDIYTDWRTKRVETHHNKDVLNFDSTG